MFGLFSTLHPLLYDHLATPTMNFATQPRTSFPSGVYLVICPLFASTDARPLLSRDCRAVAGYPNEVLESMKRDTRYPPNFTFGTEIIVNCPSPEFNMIVFQLKGNVEGAAVYGPLDNTSMNSLVYRQFRQITGSYPKEWLHMAAL